LQRKESEFEASDRFSIDSAPLARQPHSLDACLNDALRDQQEFPFHPRCRNVSGRVLLWSVKQNDQLVVSLQPRICRSKVHAFLNPSGFAFQGSKNDIQYLFTKDVFKEKLSTCISGLEEIGYTNEGGFLLFFPVELEEEEAETARKMMIPKKRGRAEIEEADGEVEEIVRKLKEYLYNKTKYLCLLLVTYSMH
jgi:hypothetical protein